MTLQKAVLMTLIFILNTVFLFSEGTLCGEEVFRVGIIGTTTSHVPAFVKAIHNPEAPEISKGFRVVAAYPGGMPDNPSSWDRVRLYADGLAKEGVKIHKTIESMLTEVDGVLLESVDGRPHLEQAKPVIAAGLPLFIDKPIAASLADTLEIFRLAEENNVPLFSASSLRFSPGYQRMRNEKPLGNIVGCDAWSPCTLNDKHPDLFWYGVHGVETLFTIMGAGCQSVSRTQTNGAEMVVGIWNEGRIGSFRGIRQGKNGYGATVFGEKGFSDAGTYGGYEPLVQEIVQFFRTGEAPFDRRETIEIVAFMEAADRSKVLDGQHVSIADTIARAAAQVSVTVRLHLEPSGKLMLDGKTVELAALAATLDALIANKENHQVRVLLSNDRSVPIESVKEVCGKWGSAVLANYLYEYE